jgi:hypothetical protein
MLRDRFRKQGPRITDDLTFRGFETLVLENRWLRIVLLPEKGSDILEFVYKPLDLDFLWRAPAGFWSLDRLYAADLTSRQSFIDYYPGGWQEILPNGGPGSTLRGAPFGEHSETPLLPWRWQISADNMDRVAVTLTVKTLRVPLFVEKTISLGEGPALFIEETVLNSGAEQVDLMWGHHPALGAPFLDGSCVIDVSTSQGICHPIERFPSQRLEPNQPFSWPLAVTKSGASVDLSRVLKPDSGTADLFYLPDLSEGWCAVTNQDKRVSFGLAWTPEVFKHLWVWHDANGTDGYPWYRQGYVLALEPWSSYPGMGLEEACRLGTQLTLQPNHKLSARLTAVVGTGFQRVKSVSLGGDIQGHD